MPQVKIKQGVKSSINNNSGVLNAGTLAVTTDTNELFVTHNDGTVHQLCDNVKKAGDTMSGDLDMGGNELKNVAIEVVSSLPTTDNFEGRQVTYQGRSCIWDGSAWNCDTIKLPPVSITSDERYKYINHNFGRFPVVQVTDSNGNIIGVDIRYIDDNNIYLSWYGSIVGTIIIN